MMPLALSGPKRWLSSIRDCIPAGMQNALAALGLQMEAEADQPGQQGEPSLPATTPVASPSQNE